MTPRAHTEIKMFHDARSVFDSAASEMARLMEESASRGARISLALSGGNTPRGLYESLVAKYRGRSFWSAVDFFWGDERYVPHGDPRSNYRTAEESLLKPLAIQPSRINAIPTAFSNPEESAMEYEETLRSYFKSGPPRFDLVLLGMGPEGHTASLFPDSPALKEQSRWVVSTTVPAEPPARITLTPPILNEARNAWFVVAGKEKAAAVRDALAASQTPLNPAGAIQPRHGSLIWWLDESAASLLSASA